MDEQAVRIRIATARDVDACARLASDDGAGDRDDWAATFARTVEDGGRDRVLFGAESGRRVVGYARAVRLDAAPDVEARLPAGWYLLGVVVDPPFRRRGIGRQLTAARVEWLRRRADHVHFFTGTDNVASQQLHVELGFDRLPGVVSIARPDGSGVVSEQVAYRLDLGGRTVDSVGYEGRSLEEFVADLVARKIDVLADVRLNPISRRRGFGRTALGAALDAAGIDYVHLRALGNPKENRPAFAGQDADAGRSAYRDLLSAPEAVAALGRLRDLVRTKHVAVMCFERDEQRCHRLVVLEELTRLD